MWHTIFTGSNVCDFSSDPQNKSRQKKKKKKKNYIIKIIILIILKKIFINTANISPAKIYSRVNILDLKFATQNYSINKEVVSVRFCNRMTKKSNLFCSFNTGYAKRSVFFKNMYFHCTYLIKTDENIINDFSGTFFLSFAKKSVPSKKNQSVLNAKISSWKIQKNYVNRQSSKINFRKKFRATHGSKNIYRLSVG